MRALLLAAGKATRLGELSKQTPKCLQLVGRETLLDRLIRQLQEVGVEEFLINTHHRSQMIVDHVQRRPDRKRFTMVYEPKLLGTLGTLRANVNFFEDKPGWVLHADNFIGGSFTDFLSQYVNRPEAVWGAMLTFTTTEPKNCGVVVTDERGIVEDFFEKVAQPPSTQASAATFIFDENILRLVSGLSMSFSDVSRDLIPRLRRRLVAWPHSRCVIDIGTPEGLAAARNLATRRGINTIQNVLKE
jgi:mannose-1-phosphate guanylyltransferase